MSEQPKVYTFEELSTEVINAIAEVKNVSPEEVSLDSTFDELGADSLDAMEMLFIMEERLDVSMPDAAARAMRNVRQVVEAVDKLLKGEELDIPEPEPATGTEESGPKQHPKQEAG